FEMLIYLAPWMARPISSASAKASTHEAAIRQRPQIDRRRYRSQVNPRMAMISAARLASGKRIRKQAADASAMNAGTVKLVGRKRTRHNSGKSEATATTANPIAHRPRAHGYSL